MEATQNFVWITRDEIKSEVKGLVIPGVGREKPITGKIISIGSLVKDTKIKNHKGQKAIFHKGVGQEIDYENKIFLVLTESQIIGVDKY